jgi:hypothetical protein
VGVPAGSAGRWSVQGSSGDRSVALILKRLATWIGFDPSRYSGHSLRSGFLTSDAQNRASILKTADQSRHKLLDVLREYVRNEERLDDHAAEGLLSAETTSAGVSSIAKGRGNCSISCRRN